MSRACKDILEALETGGTVTDDELRLTCRMLSSVNREIELELVNVIDAINESRDTAGLAALHARHVLDRVVIARKSAPEKWLGLKENKPGGP